MSFTTIVADPPWERALPTAYLWPRVAATRQGPSGVHSAKPDEFYELVEEASPGPYLELFARRTREGWTTLGTELETE